MADPKTDNQPEPISTNAPIPPVEEPAPTPEPKTYAGGKFKSPEDMEAAYNELQTKLGQQGEELGNLRNQNQQLTEQMKVSPATEKPKETPAADDVEGQYRTEIDQIYNDIATGKMSLEDGIRESNALTARHAATVATQQARTVMQQALQERDAQAMRDSFLKDNPDFLELQKSGELQKVRDTSPLHDDFSAYWAIKAQQAKDEGKAELEALQKGAAPTQTVLNRTGNAIRQTQSKPLSKSELKQKMLDAVAASRETAG
jgi:hypothetical protein